MTAAKPTQKITNLSLFNYGLLAVPLSFAGLPLYLHAPDFYAAQLGLSLTLIGVLVLAIRIFDAVQDPIIGILSDKFARYRFPIVMGSLGLLIISFMMVFHPPQNFVALWFVVSLMLASTAFSILGINLNALGSLWSEDKVQKTRITSWREGLGLIGLLIAAVMPSLVDLQYLSYTLAGLCVVAGFTFLAWSRRYKEILHKSSNFKLDLKKLNHAQMRKYYIIYAISMLASSIPGVLVIFFVRDLLNAEHLIGLFLVLYFVSGAIGMPLWHYISKRTNKLNAWFISMILAIATFIWAFFLGEGDIIAYGLVCFFSGLALGAELALPPAILSDLIDEEKDTQQTSLYFSAQAFLLKATFAGGSGIAFLILGFTDFVPKSTNNADALMGLSFTYALLPCLIKIVAIIMLYFWMKSIHHSKGDNNDNKVTHAHDRRPHHA